MGLANQSSSGSLFLFETTYDFGKDLNESGWRGSRNSKRLDSRPKASGTRISVSPNKTRPITPGSRIRLSIWRPASVNKITPGILPITLARKKIPKTNPCCADKEVDQRKWRNGKHAHGKYGKKTMSVSGLKQSVTP